MKPRILFFNINGSGMGHMNRCLAYAKALRKKAEITFFSLASAVEVIEDMGFDAEYFVSQTWSINSNYAWNTELAFRLSMVLERVQPHIIVFDGTWPYIGFLGACKAFGKAKLVWSHRGLFKKNTKKPPINPHFFDLILEPGELVSTLDTHIHDMAKNPRAMDNRLCLSPVTLLKNEEILDKKSARQELGLSAQGRFALLSLGSGNVRDVHSVGKICIELLQKWGYTVVWACSPMAVNSMPLPNTVMPVSIYPLVRVMRAFDVFIGAAGYNTCCEVVQAQIPTLLLPNTLLADDQARRAQLVSDNSSTVLCLSEDREDIEKALHTVLTMDKKVTCTLQLCGAEQAANALLELVNGAKDVGVVQRHSWNKGPTWTFISKYYASLALLQPHSWLWQNIYIFLNFYRTHKLLNPRAWRQDLKHALISDYKHRKCLLILSEGISKEEQRKLCGKVQEFLRENTKFIPVLITDTADFAFFSHLHWLVEYLPSWGTLHSNNYKKQKRDYLMWRYGTTCISLGDFENMTVSITLLS